MSRHCHCSGPIGLLYLVSALVALGVGLFLAATPLQALPSKKMALRATWISRRM